MTFITSSSCVYHNIVIDKAVIRRTFEYFLPEYQNRMFCWKAKRCSLAVTMVDSNYLIPTHVDITHWSLWRQLILFPNRTWPTERLIVTKTRSNFDRPIRWQSVRIHHLKKRERDKNNSALVKDFTVSTWRLAKESISWNVDVSGWRWRIKISQQFPLILFHLELLIGFVNVR